jgi:hypothetical protein
MKTKLFIFLTTLAIAAQHTMAATDDHADIKAEITKRHDEAVKRLQDWIAQVSRRRTAVIPKARNTWRSWRATPDFKKRT